MKTIFVGTATLTGIVSFFGVLALRKNEQKRFDAKMHAVDNWLNRSK